MEVLREIRNRARFQVDPRGMAILILLLIALKSPLTTPVLCPFRAIIGVPCPFCGMTTALGAILRLDIAGGFELHPLVLIPLAYLVHAAIRNRFWLFPSHRVEKIAVAGAFLCVWLVKMTQT